MCARSTPTRHVRDSRWEISTRTWQKTRRRAPGRSAGAISGTRKLESRTGVCFREVRLASSQSDCPYEEALYKKWPFEKSPEKIRLGTRDDSSRHETRGERARPLSHCTSRATPTTATATRTRVSAAEHRVKRIAFARSVAERGRASPSTRPSPRGETHPSERAFASPHARRTRVARWEGTSTPTRRWGSRARPPDTR